MQKTDVWSTSVVLYVLVIGYPSDWLQKVLNLLHRKGCDLKRLLNFNVMWPMATAVMPCWKLIFNFLMPNLCDAALSNDDDVKTVVVMPCRNCIFNSLMRFWSVDTQIMSHGETIIINIWVLYKSIINYDHKQTRRRTTTLIVENMFLSHHHQWQQRAAPPAKPHGNSMLNEGSTTMAFDILFLTEQCCTTLLRGGV